jgi:hypothetical protein
MVVDGRVARVDNRKNTANSTTIVTTTGGEGAGRRTSWNIGRKGGAGEWARTTDLQFTNKLTGMAQVLDDVGHPLFSVA